MSQDSTAPDPEGLRKLFGALPSMADGVVKGKIGGKGKIVSLKPTKLCKVCGRAFDHEQVAGQSIPIHAVCSGCQKRLDEGWTALKCDGQVAFIREPSLADWAGQVKEVSPYVMRLVKLKHQREKSITNGRPTNDIDSAVG